MKVTIYDKNPGTGFVQWLLKTSWLLGCYFQKLFGIVDEYYGAESWEDVFNWLKSRKVKLSVIQYWGHGSPATIWIGKTPIPLQSWVTLKPILAKNALLWFRVCSAFQGEAGQEFSKQLADNLKCTIAGHTRIIGLPFQGGLYTRAPNSNPSWTADEGTTPSKWPTYFNPFLRHTIFCLQWWIPKGW